MNISIIICDICINTKAGRVDKIAVVDPYDIYIMDADGGNLTQLTTNSSRDDKPVFAPDGKTVFFRSNRGLVWDIWTMQINSDK